MAGLNIPHRSELPHGTFLGDLNRARLDAQQKATDIGNKAVELGADVAFGEDTGDSFLEDLAYGAVPGGSLYQRAKTGTRPGLLDFADFIPGSGAVKAMLPIAVKPTLDAMKAGKRMGKTSRNLEKAQNPYIERWHRTRSLNDANIRDKGLLVGEDNPNYSKNTGDAYRLKIPAAWLGTNPSEIPVLQHYFMHAPEEVSTYRVRIPKEEYYATPRLKWDSGYRDDAASARIVGKGESSLTGEVGRRTGRESMIDLFGKSIPAEYLEKVPNREIMKHFDKNKNLEDYIDAMGEDPADWSLAKAGNQLASEDLNWMPFHDRISTYTKLKEVGDQVSYNISRRPKYPPSEHLKDVLNYFYTPEQRGPVQIPAYGYVMFDEQTRNLPSDMSRPVGKFETHTMRPKSVVQINIPTDEQIQVGAVSRGLNPDAGRWNPKDRLMNWNAYDEYISKGHTPSHAMWNSAPEILVDDPDIGLMVKKLEKPSVGHISRGNYFPYDAGIPLTKQFKVYKDEGVLSKALRGDILREVMKRRSNEDGLY